MLQYTVVIGRKTNTAGTQVNIDSLEITLHKSEELDFGVLTIPATTRFENFQILDRVDITVTDGETTTQYDPFLIVSDEVTPVSKLGYYKHTITFIEDIHKFDKILSSNVFITQPLEGERKTLLDVMNHIRDVVPFERASIHSATRLFEIDSDLADFLGGPINQGTGEREGGIDAPQFFFTGMNLREMINAVASYVNAIGRLEEGNNLVFSFYNEVFAALGIETDVIYRTLSNQTKYFTSSVESIIENAVSGDNNERAVVVYPNNDSWITPRANNLQLTDTNFEFRLPYPIETMTGVLLRAEIALEYYEYDFSGFVPTVSNNAIIYDPTTDTYHRQVGDGTYVQIEEGREAGQIEVLQVNFTTNGQTGNFILLYWHVDVSELILIKEQWDRLELDAATTNNRRLQNYQINTLFYTIGGKTASNGQLGGIFSGVNALTAFYQRALHLYGFAVGALNTPEEISNVELRFYYIPYFGTRVRLNKDDVTDHPYNTQMSANQGERIVSAERLLHNIYGMAQRLGQDEIQFKRYYTDLSEVIGLGAITEDNFVVATVQLTYNLNYVMVNYLLSKNFNRFANRIALNQENRPFDISLGSKTINRNLLYNEYVELDTVARGNTSLMRRQGIKTFMNTFRATPFFEDNKPIRFGVFKGPDVVDIDLYQGIFLKTISFAEGNSLNYYWSFDDILRAGDQVTLESYLDDSDEDTPIPIVRNQLVRYTDANGLLDEFEINFAHSLPETDGKNFPIISYNISQERLIGGNDTFIVKKDGAESLSMNYQISVVPNYKHNNRIIVGRELVVSNNLIIARENKVLVVYLSETETYNSLENRYTKGSANLTINPTITLVDEGTEEAIQASISVTIPNISNYKSWAIGDQDGNLYLGVNLDEEEVTTVYFNFVNKREKLSYTFDDVNVSPVIAPSSLTLTSTATTIIAQWVDNQTVDTYEVGIRNITIPGQVFTTTTQTAKTKEFTGLITGHIYQVRVRSIIGVIPGNYITREIQTVATPAQVQNLIVGESTSTTIFADWDDVFNESGYKIRVARPDNTGVENYQTLANSTFLFIRNRVSNRINVVSVTAFNSFGDGTESARKIGVIPEFTWVGASAISDTVIEVEVNQLPNVQVQSNQEVGYEFGTTPFTTVDSGTTTSGAINQITDSSKSFTPDALIGDYLYITSGVREGNFGIIIDNTETTITVDRSIASSPPELIGVTYRVDSIGETETIVLEDDYTVTTTNITGLTADTLYRVRVRAYYKYTVTNETVFSDYYTDVVEILAEPVITEVIQPTVTTRSGYPTTSSLGWTIFNPNEFDVRLLATIDTVQDSTPTVEYTTISPNTSISLTFGGFDYSTTQILSVRFRAGESPNFGFSPTVYNSQTTLPEPPPPQLATPTELTVTNVTSTGVTVTWDAVSGATEGYDLNVQTSGGSNVVTGFANANDTSWTYNLLNPETSYQVRIRARATATNPASSYSSFVPFTTLAGAPSRPLTLILQQAQSGFTLGINASWDSVSSATSYDFEVHSNSSYSNLVFSDYATANTSSFTGYILADQTYYCRVRAKNNLGDSDWRTATITLSL